MKKKNAEKGSITLEASIMLPFFLAFIMAMVSLVQLSVVDMALQHAVSESVKMLSGYMYPVDLLLREAENHPLTDRLRWLTERFKQARNQVEGTEQWINDHASLLPAPVVQFAQYEMISRQQLESAAVDEMDAIINSVFKPIVWLHVDQLPAGGKLLEQQELQIVKVTLPNEGQAAPYIGIEAEYRVRLLIPFFHKTIILRKRAVERVWIGN